MTNLSEMTPQQREDAFRAELDALIKKYGVVLIPTISVEGLGPVQALNDNSVIKPGPLMVQAAPNWTPEGE